MSNKTAKKLKEVITTIVKNELVEGDIKKSSKTYVANEAPTNKTVVVLKGLV